jgi:hypothetical protein
MTGSGGVFGGRKQARDAERKAAPDHPEKAVQLGFRHLEGRRQAPPDLGQQLGSNASDSARSIRSVDAEHPSQLLDPHSIDIVEAKDVSLLRIQRSERLPKRLLELLLVAGAEVGGLGKLDHPGKSGEEIGIGRDFASSFPAPTFTERQPHCHHLEPPSEGTMAGVAGDPGRLGVRSHEDSLPQALQELTDVGAAGDPTQRRLQGRAVRVLQEGQGPRVVPRAGSGERQVFHVRIPKPGGQ